MLFGRCLKVAAIALLAASCVMDTAPGGLRRTPAGPGATVRFDLGRKPLPDIPLPNDVATFPDPTSRTGLRLNVSLFAPTQIEARTRARIDQLEGWGTMMPITLAFDIDRNDPAYAGVTGAALNLDNIAKRHQGDDYDFADDAVYLVNLETGVPVVLDLGAKNFDYTLKHVGDFWPNDPRASERNVLFETIDESQGGTVTQLTAAKDTDQDGTLDVPNLDDPKKCAGPDPDCDDRASPKYDDPMCLQTRRVRDRCIADHLLTFYERETDTLILRPILPLDEMKRYAVVVTDRTIDVKGNAVKSPFDFVYPAAQESAAARVRDVINDPARKAYFGDIAGSGLDHVAFTWSFTTQPTVDDLRLIRDGLYGQGPFAHLASEYPPVFEVERQVGPTAGVTKDQVDPANWQTTAACKKLSNDLYVLRINEVKDILRLLVTQAFGASEGPGTERLLRQLENIDYVVIGTFKSPFFIEGGQQGIDPNTAFHLNYMTGEGEVQPADVQFLLTVPKATASHQQPFDIAITGHGAGGDFTEQFLYAGDMAAHGIASIGINAVGHGRTFEGDPGIPQIAKLLLGGGCIGPFYDALTDGRSRDLDHDGVPDSGGDFWTAYLFHTRDVVRQSVIDHLQLTRILRGFGTDSTTMLCRNDKTGWHNPATEPCDVDGNGKPDVPGDFDGNGVPDIGGPMTAMSTWGESLGGILAPIHGAMDPNITAVVPGSGAGGLVDVGVRSILGEVFEPIDLRAWGPLIVGIPSMERRACTKDDDSHSDCTACMPGELSVRFVVPTVKEAREVEIGCYAPGDLAKTTLFAEDLSSGQLKCARVDETGRFRVGIPASLGDQITLYFYDGLDDVTDYASCTPTLPQGTLARKTIANWGKGRYAMGDTNILKDESCQAASCAQFENHFIGEGETLVAIADGYGFQRQTPNFRRFLAVAQLIVDPSDPISFAPYFLNKKMVDPWGHPVPPKGVFTINTIGDLDVPLNAGIAFARATGAVPFLRPDQAMKYPDYADYVTPQELFTTLGNKTPNQVLIDDHVLEGVPALARHPASPDCATSANFAAPGVTYKTEEGETKLCLPACSDMNMGACLNRTHCDTMAMMCVPDPDDARTCDEALFDVDDVDEGTSNYHEQEAAVPLRLARYAEPATDAALSTIWSPRLLGIPHGVDLAWQPSRPVNALLDAYIEMGGVHTFVNGEPCQSFDAGTYFTNLVARFFMTHGTDIYYLSHPTTHLCLAHDVMTCGYLAPQ